MSSTAENFGDASCDRVNSNIKIFWALNLNFTIPHTLLIFSAAHLCMLSLRATQPGFVRTQRNWSTQAAKHPFSSGMVHHFAYPSFSWGSKFIGIIQEEESAHVRYCQNHVFSHLVVLISWFVSLQFSIVKKNVAKSAVLLLDNSNLFLYVLQIDFSGQFCGLIFK